MKILLIAPKSIAKNRFDYSFWNFYIPLISLGHEVTFFDTSYKNNENLLKLKNKKEFNLKIYYIEILYDILTKKFTKTFKLKPDDKNNWWFQNDKKKWRLEFYKFAYTNILPPKANEENSSHFDGNFSFSVLRKEEKLNTGTSGLLKDAGMSFFSVVFPKK